MENEFLFPDTGQYLCYDLQGQLIYPVKEDPYSLQDAAVVIHPMRFCKLDDHGKKLPDHATRDEGLRCIKDLNTGLIWETKSPTEGDLNFVGDVYTWNEQSEYIARLNQQQYAGHTNWRIPNRDELRSIVDYSKVSPAINPYYFPYIPNDFYWCGNTYQMQPYFGWTLFMGFGNGIATSKQTKRRIMAVCDGYEPGFGVADPSRFTDNHDGTVTDHVTGLMWQQGDNHRMNWLQALETCKNMNLAGYDDWRLPNIKELNTILNLDRTDEWWLFKDFFPVNNLQPPLLHYFTSSVFNGDFVWVTNFYFGYDSHYASKLSALLFRAVRTVRPRPVWPEFALPDSGQVTCYDNEGNYLKQSKGTPFEGQDGDYAFSPMKFEKLGFEGKPLAVEKTKAEDFLMVRDLNTGLIWELKSNEMSSLNPVGQRYTFDEALSFIRKLNYHEYGGFADWRMPNREELRSIVQYIDRIPACDHAIFPDMKPEFYWSGDPYKMDPSIHWGIYFGYGCAISYSNSKFFYIRAVRSGFHTNFGNLAAYQFENLGNGMIEDKNTNRMWMEDEPGEMTFTQALNYCRTLRLGGYSDWRLPSIKELATLVNLSCPDGHWFDPKYFPGVKTKPLGFYWSSTTFSATFGWGVNFQFGYDGYYADKMHGVYCFRPVRNARTK